MSRTDSGDVTRADLEEENRRLRRSVEELSVLNELARAIGASTSTEDILRTIVRGSLKAVDAEQGVVTLVERETGDRGDTVARAVLDSGMHPTLHVRDSLLGWAMVNRRPLLMNAPDADQRLPGVRWDESIRSLLCAPLLIKSQLIGVLVLYNKRSGEGFTEEDERLLSIVATQSAQVVENARLYEEEQTLLRVREELRLASEIQLGLLPKAHPHLPGYQIAGASSPAHEVGGDYFDFIPLDGERLAICLGDVSGKGLPAALLVSNLQAIVRGQALAGPTPKDCVERSNTLLFHSTSPEKFATFFYGLLDTSNHRLSYCNAGHERPLLLRRDEPPSRLEAAGLVLSFVEEAEYQEDAVEMRPGDTVLIYSDGVTEAFDEDDVEFGEERLLDLVGSHPPSSAQTLLDDVVRGVRAHAGTRPQTDDLTVVTIMREGGS